MSEPGPALHVTTIGEGPRTVVFLHGLLGQGKNLAGAAKSLADVATSLLVDAPDHGLSAWTEEVDYRTMGDYIADELSARGALDRPVALVGHSMGGKIAMCLTLDHPELVSKLCVVDIAPVRYDDGGYFAGIMAAMSALDLSRIGSRGEADERLAEAIPEEQVRSFVLQNLHHGNGTAGHPGRWFWRCNLGLLRDSVDELDDFPEMTGERWDGPVLWIAGEQSRYILDRYRPAMSALFPRVRELTVAGAGHWVHADRPQRFAAVLRDFVLS